MSVVKSNNITRKKASHESGQWLSPGTEKKVSITWCRTPRYPLPPNQKSLAWS